MTSEDVKVCSSCNQDKPFSEFTKSRGKPIKMCKVCRAAAERQMRQSDPEKKWLDANRRSRANRREADLPGFLEAQREYNKKWRAEHPEALAKQNETQRKKASWRKYRLSDDDRTEMAIRQGGRCKICRRELPLAVDHCHTSGRVRGLLCGNCNCAIGHLHDDPAIATAMADYLVSHERGPGGAFMFVIADDWVI